MYRDLVAKMREQHQSTIVKPTVMPAIIDKTKRRSMEGMAPVSRDFIRLLVDKVDTVKYGHSVIGGLSPAEQQQRNKALISLLYLSARRISEIVGRTYKGFIYEGVKLKDFRLDTLEGREVLIMNCLILKKWRRKADEPKIMRRDVIIDMEDSPFIEHIQAWREHQQESRKEKFMSITRSRAYQILQQIDQRIVGPHWFRHMRLSHLAETLNPFQLNERIGFWERIDPAVAYVHGRVSDYLEACENARGISP
ncbi:hypothetical protein GTO27_09875 [Candidatus Bathyarchaeota archaeon]|nr:hypothetical protein [Candidatus Bathyarchaeota archaeon]